MTEASPVDPSRPDPPRRELAAAVLAQLPLLVALVGLWMLLWGSLSVLTLLTGVAVAVVVARIFYLPPVAIPWRLRPLRLAVFAAAFAADVFVASFQVAGQALRPRWGPRSAIVAVQLRTRSDLILTLTAITASLVPGSLAVEVDRERSVLFLHALHAPTAEDVERVRRHTLGYERRLALALGGTDDVRRVEA